MRRLTVVMLAALLGVVVVTAGSAQVQSTATVEVRVWQNVGDLEDIRISARPAGGSWRTLGTIPLPLDQTTDSGTFAYGDIDLDVTLPGRAVPATVEVRVWQRVRDLSRVYISARPADGSWRTLGTIALPLDDGFSSSGTFQFGDIALDVPVPPEEVSTLAGRAGVYGARDGQGANARFGRDTLFAEPSDLALAADRDGSVIVADFNNDVIRRVAADGTVTTIAGGEVSGLLDGAGAQAQFNGPSGVAADADGNIYVADSYNRRIRKITPDRIVSTIAGAEQPNIREESRDGPADEALFKTLHGIALGPQGDLYIAEAGTKIRRLSPAGEVTTFAGGDSEGDRDGPRLSAQFRGLRAITVDDAGNIYTLERNEIAQEEGIPAAIVRVIDDSGRVRTIYRSSQLAFGGALATPHGIVAAGNGAVYLSNTGLNQVVRITRAGQLEGVAGSGERGHADGSRAEATFNLPGSLALSSRGVLFVADQDATVVRAIQLGRGGLPTTTVPLAELEPFPRVEGVTISAVPQTGNFLSVDMEVTPSGVVIAPFSFAHRIDRLGPSGLVQTFAGTGEEGFVDGPSAAAQFSLPWSVAVDADGVVYVADVGNNAIRRIGTDGEVSTLDTPDSLSLDRNVKLTTDGDGNLYGTRDAHVPYRAGESTQGTEIWRLSPDGAFSVVAAVPGRVTGMDVDGEGQIYLLTRLWRTATVSRIDASGSVATVLEDIPGMYGGVLSHDPRGIVVESDGTAYVVDLVFRRVVRITTDGEVAIVGDQSSFRFRLPPLAIALTPDGDLLVSAFDRLHRVTFPE
ncbi:MAG: hypothetical protein F4X03_00300 [Dehalococcoidia bacterium]|nr:hypothetical protein [Dehalococcoidia bacterium]MYD27351.1 hypothetical protein [Dehalococcoidia bacterium]